MDWIAPLGAPVATLAAALVAAAVAVVTQAHPYRRALRAAEVRKMLLEAGAAEEVLVEWDAVVHMDVITTRTTRIMADRGVFAGAASGIWTFAVGVILAFGLRYIDPRSGAPGLVVTLTSWLAITQIVAAGVIAIFVAARHGRRSARPTPTGAMPGVADPSRQPTSPKDDGPALRRPQGAQRGHGFAGRFRTHKR